MKQYCVTGMTCAACSARVEKAVEKVEGVESVSVSLLTNSMAIEGTAKPEDLRKAVEDAGYGFMEKKAISGSKPEAVDESSLKDTQTPLLKKRLFSSLGFLVVLMYVSMGGVMFGFPMPEALATNPMAIALVQMLLTGIVMVINQRFFISGFKSLFNKAPNMDTLVALGSGAAFVYSTIVVFQMTANPSNHLLHELYFESAAMILTLITVGKMLEAKSKGETTNALKGLMRMTPKTATVVKDGVEKQVEASALQKEDIFIVKPGESIPADGIVIEGESAVDESSLTGESIPVDKKQGETVFTATLNQSGYLKCRATKVGEDTSLSQIIRMVSDAAATKAPIAKIADKVSGIFVPAVITIAVITTLVHLALGATIGYALARGISVLVISCPCALGLATPVAIMVGSGLGAKHGILFKTAKSLEICGNTQIVLLDKTGTITEGKPRVTDVFCENAVEEEELLSLAYALEKYSEHPLAKAIVEYAQGQNVPSVSVEEFRALAGNGVTGIWGGQEVYGGSLAFIQSKSTVSEELFQRAQETSGEGKTPILFAKGDKVLGMFAIADTMKEDSREAIAGLKDLGMYVVMLTGDNEKTAHAIADRAGVDGVIADVLPDKKEEVVRAFEEYGKVMMVGDGINDAPALTRADMGVAIGTGTDIAMDAADAVLVKGSLAGLVKMIRLSRQTLRNIKQNLFWAFFYNALGIPLAAGVFIPILGWELNPMFGAAAMSLSSFCVVTNALRLNLVDLTKNGKGKRTPITLDIDEMERKFARKENKAMTKTVVIEGMMCVRCEAHVKKALEALEGVNAVEVSHEKGTAVVTMANDISDEVLTKAVEEQDYKVVRVEA